ncbi:hypothetical protein SDC9_126199 [bioreactor metagenome]|uniref:Uncharacterized protein n=1 Tax=bioreactor metagenome TaxID=1076179 RepID=A0A645CQ16_9ZZZZ
MVIPFAFIPHIVPCPGIGNVIEHAVTAKPHAYLLSQFALYKQSLLTHLLIVLAFKRYLRPYRDHQLYPHRLQLIDHSLRVREEFRIKAKVPHLWPMEEITDNDIDGQVSFFILPGDAQQLLLIPIPELALPKAQTIFRHHRGETCCLCVGKTDLCGRVPRGDKVVHLFC